MMFQFRETLEIKRKKLLLDPGYKKIAERWNPPLVDILYGVPKDTITEDIIEELAASDIKISDSDIV